MLPASKPNFYLIKKLFNNIQKSLRSPDFISEQVNRPGDFSRQRTLTFERVTLLFLQGACHSLKFGAQKLLKNLLDVRVFNSDMTISRQAVSKACRKFPYQTFITLHQQAVNTFYQQHRARRWMGFRLVGVDGTKVRLPATDEMAATFGEQTNGGPGARPMALLVAHYDVLTKIPLSAELSPCSMGERFLAERLLQEQQRPDDLYLYDRGFPSFALFRLHQVHNTPVCMRLPRNYNALVKQFIDDAIDEREVTFTPTKKHNNDCQNLDIEAKPVTLRLIRVKLKSGEIEVLATSLLDTEKYPAHLFKALYAKRWGAEEGFKALKPWGLLEVFRTKQTTAVYQEVYARVFMLALTAMIGTLAQPQVEQFTHHRQQEYKVNLLALLRKFRDSLYTLWRNLTDPTVYDQLLAWTADDSCAVRPDRSFPRKCKYINPLNFCGA